MNTEQVDSLAFQLTPEHAVVRWITTQPSYKEAWHNCTQSMWLMCACERLDVDEKLIVRAACDCAHWAADRFKYNPLIENAITAAEGWCEGVVSLEQALDAAKAIYPAYEGVFSTYADVIDAARLVAEATRVTDKAVSAVMFIVIDGLEPLREEKESACLKRIRDRIPWRVVEDAIAAKQKELGL